MYNLRREDVANREALQRLVASVTRLPDPDAARAASADGLEFTGSGPAGGTWSAVPGCWPKAAARRGSSRCRPREAPAPVRRHLVRHHLVKASSVTITIPLGARISGGVASAATVTWIRGGGGTRSG
ncbi:MAG TPA: hypothetical protein VKV38_04555 [Trebonia sp.]|nr:hypothetical protein [Trebonia sp.]